MKRLLWMVVGGIAAFAIPRHARGADGALDPSFGGGTGKVMLPQEGGFHGQWQPTDIAMQSTGKLIVSGWTTRASTECFVLRLNADGTLDTSFGGGNGFSTGYAGYGFCKYTSVAVLADDRIVAGGYGVGYNPTPGLVGRFTADGMVDTSFSSGGTEFLEPDGGDAAVVVNRIALDSGGNTLAAGYYVRSNANVDFYLARIVANGSAEAHTSYGFPTSGSYHDDAYDLAIASDGSFFLGGTATSSSGDLDCAIAHLQYNGTSLLPDATFTGSTAGIAIAKNYGGNNDDYCLALALQPPHGAIVLGGQSSAAFGGIGWDVASVTTQPADGLPNQRTNFSYWYDQSMSPVDGQIDTISRVLVEPYDEKIVLVGSGPNHASSPATGYDIGVARLSAPNITDASFGSSGFALYDIGSTPTSSNLNAGTSAVFARGRLVIVGTANDALGGNDIALIRLAPFDGIFRNGFDPVAPPVS